MIHAVLSLHVYGDTDDDIDRVVRDLRLQADEHTHVAVFENVRQVQPGRVAQ